MKMMMATKKKMKKKKLPCTGRRRRANYFFVYFSLSLSFTLSPYLVSPLNFFSSAAFNLFFPFAFKKHLEKKKKSLQHSTVFISNRTASRVVENEVENERENHEKK